jgi:hypothetical protein
MQRKRKAPFEACQRRAIPRLLRAQILLRQEGCCFDCGTRMMLGKIVFDHRPPLALRAEGEDANHPDQLVAICRICDRQKTPQDIREIARTKRLAINHQGFISRMQDKVPGRPVPSNVQWQKMTRFIAGVGENQAKAPVKSTALPEVGGGQVEQQSGPEALKRS